MRWKRGDPRPEARFVFDPPLLTGRLLRRTKRFLTDVELPGGKVVVAHCPNTGSMRGLTEPGAPVCILQKPEGHRGRLDFTLEMVQVGETWVAVNTMRPPDLVARALLAGRIAPLAGHDELRTEVAYGQEGSRADLWLRRRRRGQDSHTYVEVKNVTLAQGRQAQFPDAVTDRGRRHLRELAHTVALGHRGVMLFLVQRADCTRLAPADHIDPGYGATLRKVVEEGVEVLAYRTRVTPRAIEFDRKIATVL